MSKFAILPLLDDLYRACQEDLAEGTTALTRQAWLNFQHHYPHIFLVIDELLERRDPNDKPYDET